MSDHPPRPQTPQAMLHRLPDKPSPTSKPATKPSKYIILIIASTAVAGKVHIAKSVASALSCPLFQGDSLHETAAKAARVGAPRPAAGDEDGDNAGVHASGANEARYQRMWLSKMTRTGLLFPEESRPANEGFSGFGGTSSGSTSRRGSYGSVASASDGISTPGTEPIFVSSDASTAKHVNKPPASALPESERLRRANPALMVLTHPDLEQWHKDSIRGAVGEYSIGVIFVPLCEDEELPVLKPLDPRTMTSFGSLGSLGSARTGATGATLEEEIVLEVDAGASVEDLIEEIVQGAQDIMSS